MVGFTRLRMLTKGGSPVSFVEFQNAVQAADAMNALQGYILCPERGGIRIEFAKTKMVDNGEAGHHGGGECRRYSVGAPDGWCSVFANLCMGDRQVLVCQHGPVLKMYPGCLAGFA